MFVGFHFVYETNNVYHNRDDSNPCLIEKILNIHLYRGSEFP